jgi:anti-sigma regulatory factor (Ser/Thr protein kinase)
VCGGKIDDLPHSDVTDPTRVDGRPTAFRHDAVFYRGDGGFVPAVLPFVAAALGRGEPVLVAVPPERERALRGALADGAKRVEFVDIQAAGRNPGRIIGVWNDFLGRHAGSRNALNGVTEPVWAERTSEEIAECQRHESLLNLAFAETESFSLICPYDEAALPVHVVCAAEESHPHVVQEGRRRASARYHGVDGIGEADRRPLSPAPEHAVARAFTVAGLTSVRREVEAWAVELGVEPAGAAGLALAVHEAAVNSVLHGGGEGVIARWAADGRAVCEITDAGVLNDPLAGRSLPQPQSGGGRGLWLINQLCDLVQIRATATGLVVRMHQGSGPS